jgi:hypothetical protein
MQPNSIRRKWKYHLTETGEDVIRDRARRSTPRNDNKKYNHPRISTQQGITIDSAGELQELSIQDQVLDKRDFHSKDRALRPLIYGKCTGQ